MFVKVFKLGEQDSPLTTFPVGTHILGRGTLQVIFLRRWM
jgi:hypothetical protein